MLTSSGLFCFKGITRGKVIELCARGMVPCIEGDFTLAEFYNADEASVAGTFGGATPGPVTSRLSHAYDATFLVPEP